MNIQEFDKLNWIMENARQILRTPNTTIKLFPVSGKVRIEKLGTFPNITEAHKALKRKSGDLSAETIPNS